MTCLRDSGARFARFGAVVLTVLGLWALLLPASARAQEWTLRMPPSPRYSHAMAYDAARGVSVLFGGWATNSGRNGETWELSYKNCAADFNHDGFVNGDDYDLFAEAFETGNLSGDFNRDGFVNGDDYDFFAEAFEAGC